MLTKLFKALRAVSLGIWLGAGVMTFIAAHYVFFGGFIDRNTAGDIMASILHAGGLMKLGLAAIALGSQFGLGAVTGEKPRKIGVTALVIATLSALVVALYVEPKLLELRAQFRNDPDLNNPAHQLFGKLHGGSMGLALLEMICVAAALICAVI